MIDIPPKVLFPPPRDVHGVSGVTDAAIGPVGLYVSDREAWEGYCPAGLYGQTTNDGFGVMGIDNPDGSDWLLGAVGGITVAKGFGIAVYGNAKLAGPDACAGFFDGTVYGDEIHTYKIRCFGELSAQTKNAIVPFPDGSNRLLHCMESPEHWFEDFGSARLTRGRATVKLDAGFAKVVTLNGYRVFLTPEGDCHGLYVRSKRGSSFEVRELQGGTS